MFNPPHPGEILKELYIEPLSLTITSIAASLNVTRNTMSAIVNGRYGISAEMAIRLMIAFPSTGAEYWLNLQQQYDLWHTKQGFDISRVRVLLPLPEGFSQYDLN